MPKSIEHIVKSFQYKSQKNFFSSVIFFSIIQKKIFDFIVCDRLRFSKHKFTFRLLHVIAWVCFLFIPSLFLQNNVFVVLLCQNCLIESNKVYNYVCAWEECGDFRIKCFSYLYRSFNVALNDHFL